MTTAATYSRTYRRVPTMRSTAPGLAVVAAATALAYALTWLAPGLNASTAAVLLGAALANTGLHRPALRPGTHVAGHRLLRIAIVLLGLQLSVPTLARLGFGGLAVVLVTIAVTFSGTQLLGRWLGVSVARSLLIATGFSICGASAIAAMEPVAGGDQEDTATAVALVTLCGSLAIAVLPLLRVPLHLAPASFGSWVGASVHDVGQTVATANRVPGALSAAVVVKLTRVVFLAPLVAFVSLRRHCAATTASDHRTPPVPPFVLGFLLSVAAASTGLLPDQLTSDAKTIQEVLLTAALVGLGTGIRFRTLVSTGRNALVLGLTSWVLVAGTAYLAIRFLGT